MKLFEIKNKPAPWLLVESKEGKNVHLEHLEDQIFNLGYAGAVEALDYLDNLRIMLSPGTGSPSAKITTKWDGSPAIICGIDPADGKFFIGTKSVFSIDAKLIKSLKDVDTLYGAQPGLAAKLRVAIQCLPRLGIGNVLQGDMMFTAEDIGEDEIGGEHCYVFTPNTISYAVPVDIPLGQQIRRAKMGIVFHTVYAGPSLPEMTASYGVSVAGLNKTADVWFDDATYKDLTGRATLTAQENTALQSAILKARGTLEKIPEKNFNVIIQNAEFSAYIKPFINNNIRAGDQVGNTTQFLKRFYLEYEKKQHAEIAKLKGGVESKAAQARIEKIKAQEQFMADNSNTLLGIMAMYKKVIELKLAILRKLETVESLVGTFIKTDTGYRVMNPEGFVAVGHDGGAVKLIDRLEFSRNNFQGQQDWKRTQIADPA